MSTQMINKAIADYFKTQPVVKAWLFGSFARGEGDCRTQESCADGYPYEAAWLRH